MKKKVIIIGAGPAGLTAAYELLNKNKDYNVTILEESNSIGGISKTVNYKGNRMDIGGHRFFSKEARVNEFWQNIMPIQGKPSFDDKELKRTKSLVKGGPDPEKEDNVFLIRNRVSRIFYLKKFFDYPISMKLQTFKNLGLVRTIKSGFSYLKSIFIKKKEDSLENFYINRFGKELYSTFFEKYTEKLWGRHPKQISADWGAQRVKGLSIIAVLKDSFGKLFHRKSKTKETSLIEEYIYPKYGPGEFWEIVADDVTKMGGKILKNHQVVHINNDNNVINSVTCLVNGKEKEIKGDIFISSMPIKDLICDMNKVPKDIHKIAKGLPYRDFVTIGVLVKKLNLKNETDIKTLNNIIPDCWIYVQEPNVKLGRIQVFNNWSPYMVEKPKDTLWIGLEYFCNENDKFWNMSDKEASEFAISELEKMGIVNKDDVIDTHREKVKKAYPAYFDTYTEIDKVIEYLNKYDNLYCIGRNGQHRYNNMDHSMMTGMKAADCIINNDTNKDEIWNVNTEQEFHEEVNSDKKSKFIDKIKNIKINKWVLMLLVTAVIMVWWGLFSYWHIDNDSWFLLSHGRYVFEHGLPTIEPLTMHENLNFIMQQWLFCVCLYWAFVHLGKFFLFAFTIGFSFILLFFFYKMCMLVSNKNYIISFVMSFIMLFLLMTNKFIVTRPQTFTFLFLFLVVYVVELFRKKGNFKVLFWLPVLSVIMINFHASMWWFMYIFMLPFIAEGMYEKLILKKKNVYDYRWLIIIWLFMFLAGFINPYGVKAINYFVSSYSGLATDIILEMRPILIFNSMGIETILLLAIYVIVCMLHYSKYKEFKVSYFTMLFGCVVLSLMARKSFPYLAMFSVYPLAYYGKDLFRNNCMEKANIIPPKIIGKLLVIVVLVSLIGLDIYCGKQLIKNTSHYYIEEGVDKLLEKYDPKTMKVYCNYDSGGYLEWRGIKPFIDTRAEVFYPQMNGGYNIFENYWTVQIGTGNVNEFLKLYDFTHLVVLYYDKLYAYDEFDGYELFYEKEGGYKIYVKSDLNSE